MNCQVDVDVVPCEDLPVVSPSFVSSDTLMCDEEISAPLSEEEIVTAISKLRSGKAPGLDEISLEMLSLGGGETIRLLKSILTPSGKPSQSQGTVKVTPRAMHKKGSQTICDNYRGIALLSIPGQMFAKAILNRLKPRAEQLLCESQCGFRRGRGCADQLFSLPVLMEKACEFHQPLYACFIDLKKAHDSVHHDSLWHILKHTYHLPEKLLTIIYALHEDCTTAVRAYRKTSYMFLLPVVFAKAVCWHPHFSTFILTMLFTWPWMSTDRRREASK